MIFGSKQNRNGAGHAHVATPALDTLLAGLQRQVNANGTGFASAEVARSALSLESIDASAAADLNSTVDGLTTALESIIAGSGLGADKFTVAQREAGIAAGILAGDVQGTLRAPTQHNVVSTESMKFLGADVVAVGDAVSGRIKQALEAYDERENRNAVTYSVAYNMQAARQDEFGEAFFPTVNVTPDQVGYTVTIRLVQVYNEVRRQTSGDFKDFGKRNIIEAVIDPTILQNDTTKIYPIVRNESAKHFVAPALVTPQDILLEDTAEITTAPLRIGATFSLLGISQTEALLETGLLDSTDAIDAAVALENLYVKLGDGANAEAIKFPALRLPLSQFTYSVQNNYRVMTLNFETKSLMIGKNTKQVDGSASAILDPVVQGEYSVRLGVKVSGSVNLETSETSLFASEVVVTRITNKDGDTLALDGATAAPLVALFEGATVAAYDLDARRSNMNRRERGQLLDTTFYTQIYNVPLRSPITVPRPMNLGDQNDASDLAALITATHIRTSNAAVDELLRANDLLRDYVNDVDGLGTAPDILGVARFLVTAVHEEDTLDVSTVIDSIKSHERAADIQAVLVNRLRDMVYRMYRDSGYKAAADALAGGVAPTPTVIIGTDPVISRYLTVTGDLRTLGNDFDVKIVSTLNVRMKGKIAVSFGHFGEGFDGQPNPMHFGNMAWKPELALVLPLHRNGANSKELTVQPSFLHVTNLPVLAVLEVEGIPDVVSKKVPVYTKELP